MKDKDYSRKVEPGEMIGFLQWGQQLTRAGLLRGDVSSGGQLTNTFKVATGARESVAAHGLNRPTQDRPATHPLGRGVATATGGTALHWQPGAAALLQGPQKTSNARRQFSAWPTLRALDRSNGVTPGARWSREGWAQRLSRKPRVAPCLVESLEAA